ncbi:hypothetical protein [Runella sp. SP2]|uniref:hypothetical protein n=1 Tax=Runella sp. SP2 TaxID=2268026 RepID=UPI0013DE5CF1|nr:hypothetical protein [Runella sp. SP2]
MKNILFVSFLVISFSGFGQKSTSFGPWITMKCFSGIQVRSRLTEYNSSAKKYHYYYEMKSTYNQKVYFNYKFDGGAGLDGRTSLNPGEISTGAGNWTFGISKNGLEIEIDKVRFGNQDYAPCKGRESSVYAECDKRSSTPNWPPNCGGSDQTNIQASNTDNSNAQGASGSGAANVQAKLDAIQVYIDKIPGDDSESQAIIRDATNIINNSSTSEQTKVNQLEPLLTRAKNRANTLATTKKEEDVAKEKEDKASSERDNNFKSYYEKGMANYSSKNYDGAINNLQTSLNYAVNDQQKKHVQDWIAKIREEKRLEAEAAARKARVDDKLKQEQQVNTEAAAATTVAVALFSIMKDRYDERPANLRFQVGLGLESIPIIVNDDFNKKSSFETTLHYSIMAGLKLGLFNQNGVSFHLNPVYYLGFNAGSQGTDGRHGTYGGIATLQMGLKAESVFKLYAEGGWLKRSGNYNYDQDAASGGTTASDLVEKGTYNYGLARFGGGIMLHFVNEPKETYIKGGIYFEKLSFASKSPQMVGSLQINMSSTIILDFLYSKNYAIAGKADYPTTILTPLRSILPKEYNKSYFSVRLIRQGIF